ncbi:hypothetical protein GUJ93_ZPchr0001g32267 [Zizania palustris]|uniref:Uncharacterized protein n=1 Tax=Zizania palustris TaxID=103762 RepID=A0A8J5VML4_ZIZPA|nr:hypothetical protein GUJ93_ZPchr0001g32267 [Zizania palustris]
MIYLVEAEAGLLPRWSRGTLLATITPPTSQPRLLPRRRELFSHILRRRRLVDRPAPSSRRAAPILRSREQRRAPPACCFRRVLAGR